METTNTSNNLPNKENLLIIGEAAYKIQELKEEENIYINELLKLEEIEDILNKYTIETYGVSLDFLIDTYLES